MSFKLKEKKEQTSDYEQDRMQFHYQFVYTLETNVLIKASFKACT